jgi:(E)-4-hydroxy-3-methylbut-2-enyl-diphosphate synthase
MNRFGDTPLGMVESALEFVRIAESHHFHSLVLSMKASNPKVMIQAYRLLVERLDAAHRPYPLHLGVTEAGDGDDGRIKGAIGIGALLLDGLGDTLRVSLTEDSVCEIPVAREIAEKAMSLWAKADTGYRIPDSPESGFLNSPESIDPYHYARRETTTLSLSGACAVGPGFPPRVVVRVPSAHQLGRTAGELAAAAPNDTPVEGLLVPIPDAALLAGLRRTLETAALPAGFIALDLGPTVAIGELTGLLSAARNCLVLCRRFGPAAPGELAAWTRLVRSGRHFLAVDVAPGDLSALAGALSALGDDRLIFTCSHFHFPESGARHPGSEIAHALGAYRAMAEQLRAAGSRAPIWIRNTAANAVRADAGFLGRLIEASFLTGGLLCDGVGDLLSVETEPDPVRAIKQAYDLLQGAGARSSKTEFVACPGCGRTLFDLQSTTRRIREKTGHLKGVKIAIMGCIVNGPGEMADADFGYVGGAPGKINLYAGRECVQYNLPQAGADDRLVELIKEHGRWQEPPGPAGGAPDHPPTQGAGAI